MSLPARAAGSVLDAARSAPHVNIDDLAPTPGLLVLAPHPDDETFGCGMALAAAVAAGRDVVLVLLTDGEASHPASKQFPPSRMATLRLGELERALGELAPGRTTPVHRLRLADGKIATREALKDCEERLVGLAERHRSGTIWTTWEGDPHCDHQTAAHLARRVADAADLGLLNFPVWGRFGSRSVPENLVLFDSREQASAKGRAIDAYASQTGRLVHDDPEGFVMPAQFVEHFRTHPEIFIRDR